MWKCAFAVPMFLVGVPSPAASFVLSPHSLAVPRHLSGIYGLHNSRRVLKASSGKGFSEDTLPAKGKKGKAKKSKKASFELVDIVDTVAGASTFKTFASALSNADLVEMTLKGQGPFTVFAPTDEAFTSLPADTMENLMKPENKAELAAILTHHIVPGVAKAAVVATMNGQSSLTLNGASVAFEVLDGKVTVGGATVVATDFLASNGVVHAVDSVILPPAPPAVPAEPSEAPAAPAAEAPAETRAIEPMEALAEPVAEAPVPPPAAPAAATIEPTVAPAAETPPKAPAAETPPKAPAAETPPKAPAAAAAGAAEAPAAAETTAAVVEKPTAAPGEEPTASPAAAKARTLEDDLPQLEMEYELTTFVTKEGVAKSEQQSRLRAVQERLAKTIELKDKVESMYAEELTIVMEKLDAEVAAEKSRGEDIQELTSKFEAVLAQKAEAVERDETLLENMKSTLSLIQESSIQRTLESAIKDKAALCAIEQELMAKMQECLSELQAELKESNERGASMREVRGKLPNPSDAAAVRSYGWQDVEALNGVLQETAASAVKREAAVEAIKEDFANAMDRRRQVLSGEVPPLASNQPKLSDGESVDVSSVRADSSTSGATATSERSSSSSAMASEPPTSDELAAELTAAASEVGSIVLQLGAQLAGKAAKVATSPEAKGAAGSAGAAIGGLQAALAAASAAWDRAMEDAVSKNVGKSSPEGAGTGEGQAPSSGGDWWVKNAWNQVLNDPEVAKALKASTDAAGNAASGFGAAGSAAITGSSDDARGSKGAFDSGVSLAALQASIVRLAKVTSAVASRVTGSESNFILPPGK